MRIRYIAVDLEMAVANDQAICFDRLFHQRSYIEVYQLHILHLDIETVIGIFELLQEFCFRQQGIDPYPANGHSAARVN